MSGALGAANRSHRWGNFDIDWDMVCLFHCPGVKTLFKGKQTLDWVGRLDALSKPSLPLLGLGPLPLFRPGAFPLGWLRRTPGKKPLDK